MRSLQNSAENQEVSTMSKKLFLLAALLAGVVLLQCSKDPVSTDDEIVPEPNWYAKGLVESDNSFGLKLFCELAGEQRDSNIFISPLSVSMALGMTYNGANGTTQEAMKKTLELNGLTIGEVNESYKNLIRLLTELDPKVQFQIANSIWYEETLTPEQEFLNVCQEYFDARVGGLDFSDPGAAKTINAWVDENTQGKIQEIVDDPIDASLVSFLINAIYFKGAWTYEFDKDKTWDGWFELPDGTRKPCKIMEQRNLFKFFSNEEVQAVDLPYGDGSFSMTIFLPQWGNDVDSLIAELDQESYSRWIDGLSFPHDSFDVYIPKFTLEYGVTLDDALGALGMEVAFIPDVADFSRMYQNEHVWIDEVRHKAFVQVNEEGTEAAAATTVSTAYGPPPGFWANRPFVFVIRENESGAILFIGKIVDPCPP
jgi:serine protease inhibitor